MTDDAAPDVCICGRLRVGLQVTEIRNLNLDCPQHGLGTDYWRQYKARQGKDDDATHDQHPTTP